MPVNFTGRRGVCMILLLQLYETYFFNLQINIM